MSWDALLHAYGSQLILGISVVSYPLLFYLATPRDPDPIRFTKSREVISVLHTTLITLASIYELRKRYSDWAPSTASSHQVGDQNYVKAGARLPIITARSTLGNNITAWETGYLIQDTLILVLGARLRSKNGGKTMVKELNWRILGWHHVGLASALGVLQWYIAKGKEKGILVIVMLMLMNASYVLREALSSSREWQDGWMLIEI